MQESEMKERPWTGLGSRRLPSAWLVDGFVVFVLLGWLAISSVGMGMVSFDGVGLGLIQIVPLLWRRRAPFVVAIIIALACLLQVVRTDAPHPANVAVLIAIYSAAAFGQRLESRTVLAIGLLGAAIAGADWTFSFGTMMREFLVNWTMASGLLGLFVIVSWVLGDLARRRRAVTGRLQQQEAALARDQAQQARLVAQDERAAVAREMHDIVAHSLAVVVVQADGASYAARAALDREPDSAADRAALEGAAATLETLAQAARASLADTRRLVGVLRDEHGRADLAPLQGLDQLEELVQRVRDSGVTVHLAVRGEVETVPKDVDLAAFRVVQESLTNVMKHAGAGATVDVDLLRTPAVLLVRVTDDGGADRASEHGDPGSQTRPIAPLGPGNGLVGMTERVELLGGTVHFGPRPRGGWEVVATLPIRELSDESRAPHTPDVARPKGDA